MPLTDANGRGECMKTLHVLYFLLGCSLYVSGNTLAHSVDEVMKTFDRGPIPNELLEATKELEATAGQKSTREDAHARQHDLLEQYSRAGKERKCMEAVADISTFDEAIVGFRDQGNAEAENKLRQVRNDTAAFVKAECSNTSVGHFNAP